MATSYNGWFAAPNLPGIDSSFTAAGVKFPQGVLAGDVATVFAWLINRLNTIEPVQAGQCWGAEYRPNVNNPSTLSCHSSGTAIDYNAPQHPNGGSRYAGWSDSDVTAIRGWLAELGGVVAWGADFSGTKDPMHFEISGTAAQVAAVAARLSRDPGKVAQPSTPGTPAQSTEDDMPYSEQEVKQLVYGGLEWFFQDAAAKLDLPVLRQQIQAAVAEAVPAAVAAEVAKLLPTAIKADGDQFQAAKEIVHDGTAWALEDPAIDVSRFAPKA